jgi:hypothetical protein
MKRQYAALPGETGTSDEPRLDLMGEGVAVNMTNSTRCAPNSRHRATSRRSRGFGAKPVVDPLDRNQCGKPLVMIEYITGVRERQS